MLSTMQDGRLSIAQLLRYGSTVHGESTVKTWMGSRSRVETYRQLGARAAQLANGLHSLGIGESDRVGTLLWNNTEHLEAYLAVPAMGAVLHTLNLRLSTEQLIFITNHAADRVVILDGNLLPLFSTLLPQLKTVEHVIVVGGDASALAAPPGVAVHSYDELIDAQSDEFAWPMIDEQSAAAMCYTSGTTGSPKGVVYSHRSIWLHSMQVCMTDGNRLAQSDTVLAIVPMFHVLSWGLPYAAMMIGASLVMPDRFLQPKSLAAMLAAEKPTMAAAVPTIWQGLLTHLHTYPQDISHLREVVVGGSACPPSLMRAFAEECGVEMVQAWGMTETSPLGSFARPPAAARGEQGWGYRITQGRFPASVHARLVDEDGTVMPFDGKSVGELEVSGPWIASSYYSPDSVEVAPEAFHDGWLRTGDVGHVTPDGFLTITDRTKDIIKSGGEWISSVDLENAVMNHPAVAEAAVVAVPDPKWQERPLVVVALKQGEQLTAAALREFLSGKIAKWQLPENWSFIKEVPKTSVGKFDKKQLRARHANGALNIEHT